MRQSLLSRMTGVVVLGALTLLASGACSSDDAASRPPSRDGGMADVTPDAGKENPGGGDAGPEPSRDASGPDAGGSDARDDAGPTESTAQMISAADGGVLESDDGTLTLFFPPGALDEDTLIRVTPLSTGELSDGWGDLASDVIAPYRLEPDGLTFNETVGVVFTLDADLFEVGTGLEGIPIWGIAVVSGQDDPVVEYAGITSESPPEGTVQVLGGLEHFSEAGVWYEPSADISLDCLGPCETGTTYSGQITILRRPGFVPAREPETHVVGIPPLSADIPASSNPFVRPFTYACEETGPGRLLLQMFFLEHDLDAALALDPGQQAKVTPKYVIYDRPIECVAGSQCSTDDGDECATDSDCTTGQSCGADCKCACVVGQAGAECASNADCNSGICSNQCACEAEETCAAPSIGVDRLTTDMGAALEGFRCFVLTLVSILHSSLSVGSQDVAHDHTTLAALWFAHAVLGVDPLFNNSTFPCGDGPAGMTLCQDPGRAVPDDESLVFVTSLEGDIPLSDPTNYYQYAFVFDQDGDPDNNYGAPADYPNDFFDGTDRWYEARYAPGSGWSLVVTDATDGNLTTVASDARLIIKDHVLTLVVPAGEFAVADPAYRVTAFRHTGDYGINPPHDWDGSIWPAVADGLQSGN